METVTSLVPNNEHVAMARQKLEVAGFAANKIDVLFHPAAVWQRLDGRQQVRSVFKITAVGGLMGLFVGALYGVPTGVLNCLFMNCPVETSVVLWALISLYWVAAGGFLGAIVGIDRMQQDLSFYVDGVRRGEALFVVDVPEGKSSEVMDILRQKRGTIIHAGHQEANFV